jgi:catechol 2,3-dioxygenase-like lactoylglutathione lyase family enzyme
MFGHCSFVNHNGAYLGVTIFFPGIHGFHHIALVTRDLDATMRFYTDVLGMEVIFVAPAGDLHGRHCAIRPGGDPDRLGLHFFEYPKAPLFGPEDRPLVSAVFDPGATFLSHISLALPNEAAGLALQARLTRHSVVMCQLP